MDGGPHIIWVVLDATRAGSCSLYRDDISPATTPSLARLAEEAVVYERASSCACWTMPSHASMFTGTYPSTHGLVFEGDRLGERFVPVADSLQRLGYRTVAYADNPYVTRFSGLDRGFEHFVSGGLEPVPLRLFRWSRARSRRSRPPSDSPPAPKEVAGVDLSRHSRALQRLIWEASKWVDKGAQSVITQALERIREIDRAGVPGFIFVHLGETHAPYLPMGRFRARFLAGVRGSRPAYLVNQNVYRFLLGEVEMTAADLAVLKALYHASIAYLDWQVGRLVDGLRRRQLLDRTLLVVTADHGENVGEFGMMGHQFCLTNTLLHVPLVVRFPGGAHGGARLPQLVQHVDLPATLLEQVPGAAAAEERARLAAQQWAGRALPVDPREPDPRPAARAELLKPFGLDSAHLRSRLSALDRQLVAVQDRRWKLVWESTGREQLFDLLSAEGEDRDLSAEYPGELARLRAAALPHIEAVRAFASAHAARLAGRGEADLDAEVRERLQALGYIDS